MDTTQTTSQPPRTDVSMLVVGDFIQQGQIVSVHRPCTDFPHNKPATVWIVDYVESPDDDAPVEHARFAAGSMVESWS